MSAAHLPPVPPATETTGRISVHPRGFGFLAARLPGTEDAVSAFIVPPDLNPFLAGDLVSATLTQSPLGRYSATDLRLLERPRTQLFGEVVQRRGALFLRADREIANTDWPLDTRDIAVQQGTAVVAHISGQRLQLLRIIEPGADLALEQVIARHGLLTEFPEEVLREAREIAQNLLPAQLIHRRRDLRQVPTVTVDAPSTRDIDDAISVLPAGPDGAIRLLVSIADVAEAVAEGSKVDEAARARATSVYLAGRVLPMLPEDLSAAALSLLPGVDRLSLTVELRVDPEGRITATDVYESVMRSFARLSYTEFAAYLDHGQIASSLQPVAESLPWFRAVSARIALSRARRGGMAIAQDETRVILDAQTGAPAGIESDRPTSAHAMIERFMVAANEAIAGWLADRGVPALFRVHDEPDPRSVADLGASARHFGFAAGFGKRLTPLSLAAFDLQIEGAAYEPALRSVLRRCLGPARYTPEPLPHFGLAAPLYLHFTSPIRRYADLYVHRIIKRYLHGQRDFSALSAPQAPLFTLAEHINRCSVTASRAENDRRRILLARLLSGHIGEVHEAHITRVRPFGLIAQIDATLVEGTLPLDSLPGGPYRPDQRETAVVGPQRSFAIGMPVRVRITAADALLGRIEFAPVE